MSDKPVVDAPFETREIVADSVVISAGKGKDRFRGACSDEAAYYPEGLKWSQMRAPKAVANCLFIYPGITSPGWGSNRPGQTSNEAVYMSHGMAYVSAAMKARGHMVRLLDMRKCRSWPDFAKKVCEADYDVVFIGFLSLDVFAGACAVRVLKEEHPDRPVIVGGLHVTCTELKEFPDDGIPDLWLNRDDETHPLMRQFLEWKGEKRYEVAKFPKADCVVWNEAEIAACYLAEDVAVKVNIPRFVNARTIPDLNETPHCDRDLFDFENEANAPLLKLLPKPFATVTFGRGCPFACGFCNVATQLSSSKVRTLKPDYFMDELLQIKNRFGKIGSIMIHDDILLYPEWIEEWCELIIKTFGYLPFWCQLRADFIVTQQKKRKLMETMARAGLVWVSIGLESGAQRVLDFMHKQTTVEQNHESCSILKGLGVNVFGNWMLGLPTETDAEMKETAQMMKVIAKGGIRHSASVYTDYPGTSLARYLKMTNGLEDRWYARSHHPWQRAIRGINYDKVYEIQRDVLSNAGDHAELPNFWPRGLPTE